MTPASSPRSRLLESGPMAVKRCRHGMMMYNVNDAFIGRSLELYGEWCDAELELIGHVLVPGAVVVDVGANIGTHTVFSAKKVTESGTVIAFEPQRLAYQTLCGNVALNGLGNVTCIQAAAGSARGQLNFPSVDPHATLNFGAIRAIDEPGETVDVIPIDDLGLPRCSLIKVDVEGMEASVLEGAKETIRRCQPALFLENDTVERARELFEAIDWLGYKAFWQIASFFNPKNFFGNPVNVFDGCQPEANVFCVPKDWAFDGLMPVEGPDDDWKKAVARMIAAMPD